MSGKNLLQILARIRTQAGGKPQFFVNPIVIVIVINMNAGGGGFDREHRRRMPAREPHQLRMVAGHSQVVSKVK